MSYSTERCCVQYTKPTAYLNGGIFEKKCIQNKVRYWLVDLKNVISALQEPNTAFSWEAAIMISQLENLSPGKSENTVFKKFVLVTTYDVLSYR